MSDLYQRCLQIIRAGQHPSGAYVASPSFPTYRYSWFRDSSFIAYAMDLAGDFESARGFHDWAAKAILSHKDRADRAVAKGLAGQPLDGADILHTRYTFEGQEANNVEWPNFQLDGFGTWLWALERHTHLAGTPAAGEWLEAARVTASYLAALWQAPCFDCWEEFPDKVHTHTLAAVYGGLEAHTRLAGDDHLKTLDELRTYTARHAVYDGYFVKFGGSYTVDASLLGVSTPYRLADPADPHMLETARRIERDLRRGGVHRYPTDTYYGGGEWVLLAGWLGWYYVETGQLEQARQLKTWIEAQAGENGELPEQVPTTLIDPNYYQPWVRQWGPVANPLLWSQAMYVILVHKLAEV